MSKYRASVIGCGNRSRMHIEAYKHIESADVVACCDIVREKADERAKEFGIEAYYDAEEMIAEESPDLVHITTRATERVDVLCLVIKSRRPGLHRRKAARDECGRLARSAVD